MFRDIEYHFGLTNTYDHNKVVNTEIMVDTERKILNFDFAYNSGKAWPTFLLKYILNNHNFVINIF